MRMVLALALAGCACPNPPVKPAAAADRGSSAVAATACPDLVAKVTSLYRAEAASHEPGRVDETAADNTAMWLRDCQRDPARVAPCASSVRTAAELDQRCLIPLDDDGSEGDAL